jgi:hypothetical protein
MILWCCESNQAAQSSRWNQSDGTFIRFHSPAAISFISQEGLTLRNNQSIGVTQCHHLGLCQIEQVYDFRMR